MATSFEEAFERAGLPTGAIAFASACRDLAILALNQKHNNAHQAVDAWLELSSHQHGFRMALAEYLESIAAERLAAKKSAEGRDRDVHDTQNETVPPSVDTPKREEEEPNNKIKYIEPSTPRVPTPDQIRAITEAKVRSARVMSGVYITERQGSRTPIEDVTVASLDRRLHWSGARVAKSALEYNTLWLVNQQIEEMGGGYIPPGSRVGDILDVPRLIRLYNFAHSYGDLPMVQIPKHLRPELPA
jgi:hypothetical protein